MYLIGSQKNPCGDGKTGNGWDTQKRGVSQPFLICGDLADTWDSRRGLCRGAAGTATALSLPKQGAYRSPRERRT